MQDMYVILNFLAVTLKKKQAQLILIYFVLPNMSKILFLHVFNIKNY